MPATGFYIDSAMGIMTSLAAQIPDPKPLAVRLASRGDLTSFLMELTSEINADSYMLVAIVHDRDRNDARIVASNWIFDAIELAGHRLIASLAQSPLAVSPGIRPRGIVTAEAPALPNVLSAEEAKLLDVLGHGEIFALKLNVGRQRLFLMFSAAAAGRIEPSDLMRAQMKCCYALSQVPELLAAAALQDPLSDRERECLFWVSEGKTTDEVAVILGVSSNTVNSYITHAIQKFSAPNRAAAVATAIRSGII
jgi:DNA-binding CsgD family transcriptional regulator